MNQELICELNLALVPDQTLANQHISLSHHMAKQYSAVIELNGVGPKVAFTPHLTIYQVPIQLSDMLALYAALASLTPGVSPFALNATEFGYNANEESFEVRYEWTRPLMRLQEDVIGAANPLRGTLLLQRDPAGRPMLDRLAEQGIAGDNIRRTGFDAVGDPGSGGLFHPHVTINWFEPGTSVQLNAQNWPRIGSFNGRFAALGMFVLGPFGTCVQRLAAFDLAA